MIDASRVSEWRCRLFAAPLHYELPIDSRHPTGYDRSIDKAIRRYGLRYVVSRVPPDGTPFDDPGYEGLEIFRFCARDYPDIVNYSANNPESI